MKKEILIDGEIIHLKKDFLGWRVIEPPTKWWHYILGSKKNLIILIVLLFIAGMLYLGISEVISQYKDIAAQPCKYCITCISRGIQVNITNLSRFL